MELLIVIIVLALVFDYINGFHDAANSIATIVSTKVLTPFTAVLWAAFFNFVAFFIHTLDRRNIQRRRHIIYDSVQQHLYSLVSVRASAHHRDHTAGYGFFSDNGFDLSLGDLLTLEELHHQFLVSFGNGLDKFFSPLVGHVFHIGRNICYVEFLSELVLVNLCFHLYQVDNSNETIFGTDWKLYRNGIGFEPVFYHIYNPEEVGSHDVHLVDEYHSRNAVLLGLSPYGLGLRLNASLGAEYSYRAVQDSQ